MLHDGGNAPDYSPRLSRSCLFGLRATRATADIKATTATAISTALIIGCLPTRASFLWVHFPSRQPGAAMGTMPHRVGGLPYRARTDSRLNRPPLSQPPIR